ncbi:MAG: NAD-dependent epimerase/dehydratase family protein [Candidatus Aenigmarchaeota archaeon]|nr:NAD-dependent epimerase/dehydratase family protein [Candidatus Aenigmarchaeota archaeon]
MEGAYLVTEADGFLGNNLVRILLSMKKKVKAGVKNTKKMTPFTDILGDPNFHLTRFRMHDRDLVRSAMNGVDVVFFTSPFESWKNFPSNKINLVGEGMLNVLETAKEMGVMKLVYVSSVEALGEESSKTEPFSEDDWNDDMDSGKDFAYGSTEKLALEISEQLGVPFVSVVPSGVIGPNIFRMNDALRFLYKIYHNLYPYCDGPSYNFVDVRDVAKGMMLAAERGEKGKRYILCGEDTMTTHEIQEEVSRIDSNVAVFTKKLPKGTWAKMVPHFHRIGSFISDFHSFLMHGFFIPLMIRLKYSSVYRKTEIFLKGKFPSIFERQWISEETEIKMVFYKRKFTKTIKRLITGLLNHHKEMYSRRTAYYSNMLAKEKLGWKPRPIKETLDDTLKWMDNNILPEYP